MCRGLMLFSLFLLELAALAALAWWGFTLDAPAWRRLLAGVGAPLVAAVLWGLFAAPKARFAAPGAAVAVKIVVYGAATLALAAVGHIALAALYLALVLLATGLIRVGS